MKKLYSKDKNHIGHVLYIRAVMQLCNSERRIASHSNKGIKDEL